MLTLPDPTRDILIGRRYLDLYSFKILAELLKVRQLDTEEIAKRTRIHRNSVNKLLDILSEMHLIERRKINDKLCLWYVNRSNPKIIVVRRIIEEWLPLIEQLAA